MKVLTLDVETHDPYIERGVGAGWVYGIKVPGSDFEVLGVAMRTHTGELMYETDFEKVKAIVDEHDAIVAHNAQYDIGCLHFIGANVKDKKVYDTEMMARLFHSSDMTYGLDAVAKRYLGWGKKNTELTDAVVKHDLFPWLKRELKEKEKQGDSYVRERPDEKKLERFAKKNMKLIQEHDFEAMAQYAIGDIEPTYRLYEYFLANGLDRDMAEKYSALCHICISYRLKGVRIDCDRAREVCDELTPIIAQKTQAVYDIAGREFNINSPKEVPEVFDELGIKYPTSGNTGRPNITSPWLEKQDHAVCKAIVEARKAIKIKRDFIQKILDIQEWTCPDAKSTGRVYPELHMLRARTGRASMTSPNCFNKDTEILTPYGWCLIKDLGPDDRVAQYWEDGTINFVKPTAYFEQYTDTIYDIYGKEGSIDLSVTADHRLLLRGKEGSNFVVNVGGYCRDMQQICAGEYNGHRKHRQVDLDLIFAIHSQGRLTSGGVSFRGRRNERFYSTVGGGFLLFEDIPEYVWDYVCKSSLRLRPTITSLSHYDIVGPLLYWQEQQDLEEWRGKSKSDADCVQALLCLSGYTTKYQKKVMHNKVWHTISMERKDSVSTDGHLIIPKTYNDKTYCVSVPSGFIVVRRNNVVAITGQCQQIPARDPVYGPLCRSIFLPEEGENWYSLDFCYSSDTEVLTGEGFKKWEEVTYADKLAQVCTEGNISYDTPEKLISLPYTGTMYRQKGKHIDLLVSPNHDLLVCHPTTGEFKRVAAKNGLPRGHKNLHAAVQEGWLDRDMRLQVAIDADGSVKKGLCTFYLKKDRKIERLIALLGDTPHTIRTDLPSKPGYTAIYFRWPTKRFDREVLDLTVERRREFLEELQHWDGSKGQYFTALESHAKLVQEVAIKTGYRASISTSKGGYSGSTIYIVYFSPKRTTWTCSNSYTQEGYDGTIYCATMPKGTLIVRRNNKVSVGSNCNQEGRIQVHYANRIGADGAAELVSEFNKDPDLDMHQKVADIAGISRREAKTVNLGLAYGAGIRSLAGLLGVSESKARDIKDRYNRLSPFLQQLSERCKQAMAEKGYVITLGGRHNHIDPPLYENGKRITFEYKALNKLIQSSAADQTIECMIQAYKEGIPVLFPIHDELVMSGNEQQALRLKEIMENAVKLDVPVVVGYNKNKASNWAEGEH